MGTFWVGGASGATGYRVKITGGGARGNKSEGFSKEVHRRYPPVGRRGPQRRLDRKRPRYQPFVGAIVPLAQRHLPSQGDLDAARSAGLLLLRGRARADRSRRLVRSRDRERPALAEGLERHREGRAPLHTDQDSSPEARGRQRPGDPLASISARSALAASVCRHGASRLVSTLGPSGFLVSMSSLNVPDPPLASPARHDGQDAPLLLRVDGGQPDRLPVPLSPFRRGGYRARHPRGLVRGRTRGHKAPGRTRRQ
jgi:hypothetical protein